MHAESDSRLLKDRIGHVFVGIPFHWTRTLHNTLGDWWRFTKAVDSQPYPESWESGVYVSGLQKKPKKKPNETHPRSQDGSFCVLMRNWPQDSPCSTREYGVQTTPESWATPCWNQKQIPLRSQRCVPASNCNWHQKSPFHANGHFLPGLQRS